MLQALIPLAMIAANLLTKGDEKKKAKQDAYEKTIMNIRNTRARQAGAQPYSAMTDSQMLANRDIDREFEKQQNPVGIGLQSAGAIGGLFGGSGGGSEIGGAVSGLGSMLKGAKDERSAYEDMKGGELASGGLDDGSKPIGDDSGNGLSDATAGYLDGALKDFDAHQSLKGMKLDEDDEDPWKIF